MGGRDGGGEENMDYKQIGLGKVSCMRCCKEFCGGGSEQCFFLEANLIICIYSISRGPMVEPPPAHCPLYAVKILSILLSETYHTANFDKLKS